MGFNVVVFILTLVIATSFIPLKFWSYDKCYDRSVEDFKVLISICDVVKDIMFVYWLLYGLLYGF